MIKNFILVGIGGFFGSGFRYLTYLFFNNIHTLYPNLKISLATLTVNVLGSFLVGLISATLDKQMMVNNQTKLLLITGILGGFTTFSAFSLESYSLMREQEYLALLLNISLNVILGVIAVILGFRMSNIAI